MQLKILLKASLDKILLSLEKKVFRNSHMQISPRLESLVDWFFIIFSLWMLNDQLLKSNWFQSKIGLITWITEPISLVNHQRRINRSQLSDLTVVWEVWHEIRIPDSPVSNRDKVSLTIKDLIQTSNSHSRVDFWVTSAPRPCIWNIFVAAFGISFSRANSAA